MGQNETIEATVVEETAMETQVKQGWSKKKKIIVGVIAGVTGLALVGIIVAACVAKSNTEDDEEDEDDSDQTDDEVTEEVTE